MWPVWTDQIKQIPRLVLVFTGHKCHTVGFPTVQLILPYFLFTNMFYPYSKVHKFSDARKLPRNLPKIQAKRPNLRVFRQKDANGKANSEDPDQTAPLGAV